MYQFILAVALNMNPTIPGVECSVVDENLVPEGISTMTVTVDKDVAPPPPPPPPPPTGSGSIDDQLASMSVGEWRQIEMGGLDFPLIDSAGGGSILDYSHGGHTCYNQRLMVLAGETHEGSATQIITYDMDADQWTRSSTNIVSIGHSYDHMTVDEQCNVYVRGYNSNRVAKYDRMTGSWSRLPDLPTFGYHKCCTSLNYRDGKLIYYDPYLDYHFLEFINGSWVNWPDGNFRDGYHVVGAVVGNTLYYGGGNDELRHLWAYDGNTITRLNNTPVAIGSSSSQGRLIELDVLHAISNSGELYRRNNNDTWSFVANLPISMYGSAAFPYGNSILFIDGSANAYLYKQ